MSEVGLAIALAALPSSLTTLNLSYNCLNKINGADLKEAFATLSSSITILDLSMNDLDSADLAIAFSALPANLTALNLSNNSLGKIRDTGLASVFAALPPYVTTLDLSTNSLGEMSGDNLKKAFAALPPSVTTLKLDYNQLDKISAADLVNAFAALSYVETLSLAGNELGNMSATDLASVFAAFPSRVTHLNLDYTTIWTKSEVDLAISLAAMPFTVKTITSLELGIKNPKVSIGKVDPAFHNLPPQVEFLHLVSNKLSSKVTTIYSGAEVKFLHVISGLNLSSKVTSGTYAGALKNIAMGVDIVSIVAAIPRSISHLILRWNNLDERTAADLANIFATLPPNVKTLDLICNDLNKLSAAELTTAFAGISSSLKTLNLEMGELDKRLTLEELVTTVATLPAELDVKKWPHNWNRCNIANVLVSAHLRGETLDLSHHDLWRQCSDELAVAFAAIPRYVTTLDLSDNSLRQDHLNALSKLPPWVKRLNLSDKHRNWDKLPLPPLKNESITHLKLNHDQVESVLFNKLFNNDLMFSHFFPALINISLTDKHKCSSRDRCYHKFTNREFDITNAPPSLRSTTCFFVAKNKTHPQVAEKLALLPEELKEEINWYQSVGKGSTP